ncbi:hypothetical protein D3C86_1321440 [compost metagenome]
MRRMLQHAAIVAHGCECRSEAALVLAQPELVGLVRGAMEVAPPALARRMCNDRQRSGVLARIAGLVPRVHARHAEVGAFGLDVQRGDQSSPPIPPAGAMPKKSFAALASDMLFRPAVTSERIKSAACSSVSGVRPGAGDAASAFSAWQTAQSASRDSCPATSSGHTPRLRWCMWPSA